MKTFSPVSFILVGMVCVSACSVSPSVKYTKILQSNDANNTQFDTFSLQSSKIIIDVSVVDEKASDVSKSGKAETGKGDSKKESKPITIVPKPISKLITISSVPKEFGEFKMGLTHDDPFWASTTLNIAKRENTDLIKEIGVEVSDKRTDIIAKVGGILVKVAGLVAFDAAKEKEHFEADIDSLLAEKEKDPSAELKVKGSDFTIDFGALPKDAKIVDSIDYKNATNILYYSACRSATIKYGDIFSKTVKVADPRYVQAVGFPLKGKIVMHSECGVSVVSEKETGVASNVDIVGALVAQGGAIKDAIDAAKKEDKK